MSVSQALCWALQGGRKWVGLDPRVKDFTITYEEIGSILISSYAVRKRKAAPGSQDLAQQAQRGQSVLLLNVNKFANCQR